MFSINNEKLTDEQKDEIFKIVKAGKFILNSCVTDNLATYPYDCGWYEFVAALIVLFKAEDLLEFEEDGILDYFIKELNL